MSAVGTIEIREHPARATMPDGKLIINPDTGKTLPLITDVRAVYFQGRHVGWCGAEPRRPLTFIVALPDQIQSAIRTFVEKDINGPTLPPVSPPLVDDEDEGDEE